MIKIETIDNNQIPKDYYYDTETSEFYVYRHKYTGDEIHVAKEPPLYVNTINIPENATNGDMFISSFPNMKITYLENIDGYVATHPALPQPLHFTSEWWNAMYISSSDTPNTGENND